MSVTDRGTQRRENRNPAHKSINKKRPPRRGSPSPIEFLEDRRLLSVSTINDLSDLIVTPASQRSATASALNGIDGYTPEQIRKAYGFDQVTLSNGKTADGSGQTIAIVTAYNDPNIASDLHTFDSTLNISDPGKLSVVSQTGGSPSSISTDAGWAMETALDVEWAHAVAPGANILLVEAKSASLSDLLSAVNYARNAQGVSVVSMSWGGSEFWSQSYYDKYFTTPSGHQGVTFVAASGDNGSWWGPSWPSSSPNVLAVGGTTLNIDSTGNTYGGENGWGGSGGGFSGVESEPSYQTNAQGTGARTTPDVSYDANPYTGFAVYNSVGQSGWDVVGGTSAGTPQWAGLIALANQSRAVAGKGSLDGATGTLPTLYSLYNDPTAYSAAFHDVTSGRSSFWIGAGSGYDLVTGLGSPKAPGVVAALTGKSSATTTTTTQVAVAATANTTSTTTTHRHTSRRAASVTDTSNPSTTTTAVVAPPPTTLSSTSSSASRDLLSAATSSAAASFDSGTDSSTTTTSSAQQIGSGGSRTGVSSSSASSSPSSVPTRTVVFSTQRVSATSAGYEQVNPPQAPQPAKPTSMPTTRPSNPQDAPPPQQPGAAPNSDAPPPLPDGPDDQRPAPPEMGVPRVPILEFAPLGFAAATQALAESGGVYFLQGWLPLASTAMTTPISAATPAALRLPGGRSGMTTIAAIAAGAFIGTFQQQTRRRRVPRKQASVKPLEFDLFH
jgi:subtilase family serine protease